MQHEIYSGLGGIICICAPYRYLHPRINQNLIRIFTNPIYVRIRNQRKCNVTNIVTYFSPRHFIVWLDVTWDHDEDKNDPSNEQFWTGFWTDIKHFIRHKFTSYTFTYTQLLNIIYGVWDYKNALDNFDIPRFIDLPRLMP